MQQQVTVGSKMVLCPPASTRACSPTELRSLSVTRGEDAKRNFAMSFAVSLLFAFYCWPALKTLQKQTEWGVVKLCCWGNNAVKKQPKHRLKEPWKQLIKRRSQWTCAELQSADTHPQNMNRSSPEEHWAAALQAQGGDDRWGMKRAQKALRVNPRRAHWPAARTRQRSGEGGAGCLEPSSESSLGITTICWFTLRATRQT